MIARLLALIALVTGIVRVPDPYLAGVAASRIPELERHWANPPSIPALSRWSWGEVAGRNGGYADPVQAIVDGWMASPEHRPILIGPYTRIGCATATDQYAVTYFVCILGTPVRALPDTAFRIEVMP